MKIKITEATKFTREKEDLIGKKKLLAGDVKDLENELIQNPEKGELIQGTGGIRKARLKSPHKGKSGGFRVCYYYYKADAENGEIFLLMIYPKNVQENLTADQKKALKNLTRVIKGK